MSVPRDRRRALRVLSRLPLRYRLIPVLDTGYASGEVEDLSADGVRFSCPIAVRARSGLLFEIALPGAPPVCSFARAAWVRKRPGADGFEIGSRFVDQSTTARKAIERHLQSGAAQRGP